MKILQKEAELQEIVQLVGPDALPERERVILEISRIPAKDFESIIIEAPTIPLHGPVIVAPGHGEKATVSSETP